MISVVMILAASCQKTTLANKGGEGYLSFDGMVIDVDEDVLTKASPAPNYYTITVLDEGENPCLTKTYGDIKAGDVITLPAGNYTLVASSEDEIPEADWERPVYRATHDFTITPGETVTVGELVCTLAQCKVSIDYSPEFLDCVTGVGKTTVTLMSGFPLEYTLNADRTYENRNGFFALEGNENTLTVVFQGNIDGQSKKMTKVFTGIAPRQWRQIKFIQKVNEEGDATFDIVINPLVSDATLNNVVTAPAEEIIGVDPEAPKGDGGIKMEFDYEGGCDPELTDLENMLIVPLETRDMNIILKATVPAGVLRFTVEVESDNPSFSAALDEAGGSTIDLVNPSPESEIIFQVVPFPHGADELMGQTDIKFDLSKAQDAILLFKGYHRFLMKVVDNNYCSKEIPVVMIVE